MKKEEYINKIVQMLKEASLIQLERLYFFIEAFLS